MRKVLIADDEKGICKLLQYLIDWNSFGLEISHVVYNGWDALRCIEETLPDLVITDVCMPEYNGIDIIKRVKASNPNIRFIVISGYREFEYARDALKYGADDYLLKPIKKDELSASISRIMQDLAIQTQSEFKQQELQQYVTDTSKKLREDFVSGLITKNLNEEQLSYQYCVEKLHREFDRDQFLSVIIKADMPDELISNEEKKDFFGKKVTKILEQELNEQEIVFCQGQYRDMLVAVLNFHAAQLEGMDVIFYRLIAKIRDLLKMQNPNVKLSIAKSKPVQSIQELPDAMHQAVIALWERIRKNKDGILAYQSAMREQDPKNYINYEFQKNMLKAFETYDFERAQTMLKDIRVLIGEESSLTGYTVYEIYNEFCSSVFLGVNSKFPKEQMESYRKKVSDELQNASAISDLEFVVDELLRDIFGELKKQREMVSRTPISKAKIFIEEHYHEDIDLDSVSKTVGFNASYFSRLFKEETGKKFIDYLTEIRIQEAKRLLSESDMPIAQVAEAVGYKDDKYFSRAFKKSTGLKPKEYRKLYCM